MPGLDEASSSLDEASDQAIQRALRTAFDKDTTILVVAHRMSTITDLDYILLMENGTVVEEGKPEQLLAMGGRFASLAREHRSEKS